MGRSLAARGSRASGLSLGKVPFSKADGGVESELLTFLCLCEFQSPSN